MSDTTYYPFDPPESYRDYIMKMMEADLRKATSVFNMSTSGPVQMPTDDHLQSEEMTVRPLRKIDHLC